MATKEIDTTVTDKNLNRNRDANRDPISGAAGAHPVGVGVGAAAMGAAGAAIGSVVPGVGTLIGASIGAVLGAIGGGYAGKGVAEVIDPTGEEAYWRDNVSTRPYYDAQYTYDNDYAPAYGYGYALRSVHRDRSFDEAEPELRNKWESNRGSSRLEWDRARGAVSDAWKRYDDAAMQRKTRNLTDANPD